MQQPKIAACLILKDSEATIEKCLAAIRPHVDGVFVYDTGSTDGTLEKLAELNEQQTLLRNQATGEVLGSPSSYAGEIAEEIQSVPLAPIHITRGEWRKDFSWARQQNWDTVPEEYDWLLWLDDDDIIVGAEQLRGMTYTAPPAIDGYVFYYDYARDEAGNCVCQLWRERLVRRASGFRWQGAVHEVLVPEDGHPPQFVTIPPNLCHYLHERPSDRFEPGRNLEILEATAKKEEEEHGAPLPRTLAYIGTELMSKGNFDLAISYLEKYLEHPQSEWSDERSQVRHKLATCLRALAAPQAAVEIEFQGIKERDDWTENHVGLAGAFAELGLWSRAEEWGRRALLKGLPQSPLILNPMEHYLLPLLIVADACANQQDWDGAREVIALAAEKFPLPDVVRRRHAVEEEAKRAEIVGAIMLLREILIRHDENLKAWQLMNAVPYLVENHPMIVMAKSASRENVLHALKPDEYKRWYEDEPKESTIEDEQVETVGDYIERAAFTLEGLREQEQELGRKPRVLDMGGNDMWLACYLWKQGEFVADGVELNKDSVKKGIKRMARFGAPGKLVQGDLHDAEKLLTTNGAIEPYDAVLMFEVLEHVPDVDAALAACESVLAPGGRVYVTTPAGAFERGQIDRWQVVERKGHLRALTPGQFALLLSERGALEDFRVHHYDGRLSFARYRKEKPKGDVVFYAGASFESWSPDQIRRADDQGRVGLGGSETALSHVAGRLARRGYRVRVYSGADEGLYGGALWLPNTAFDPTEEIDLLVVSRLPHIFDNPVGAKRAALWCHDHSYPGVMTEERAAKMTDVVVLSKWQRDRFARLYPYVKGKLRLIRNGIPWHEWEGGGIRFPDYSRKFDEREPRCVYASSADRGLEVMISCWPRIREQVPVAELHIYYGFDVLEKVAYTHHSPNLIAFRNAIVRSVDELGGEEGGIFIHGRVGQDELYEEMQRSRVWSYPTAFLETSCITAMEARASGLAIVTSDLGALHETVGSHGHLIGWGEDEDEPHNKTDAYQEEFVAQVCEYLTNKTAWNAAHARSVSGAALNDWERRIDTWVSLADPAPRAVRRRKRKKVAA